MTDVAGTIAERIALMLEQAAGHAHAGEWHRVESMCRDIISLDSENILALYLISISYVQMNDNINAINFLKLAINIDKDDVNKLSMLANLLAATGRNDEVLPYLRRVVQLTPSTMNLNTLAAACADAGLLGEAIAVFRRSLDQQPTDNIASAGLYPLLRLVCNWSEELRVLSDRVDALNSAALATGRVAPEPPFDIVHRVDDPAANLDVARSWSRVLTDGANRIALEFQTPPRRSEEKRLRIGYLSGDFHDHAIAHLTRGLYRVHDRGRVSIHAYSYGPDDGSPYRRDIRQACDTFVDLADIGDIGAARRIAADGIDILVDLKGFTRRHRLAICALRPAPIQVTYLGFPGTTGADFFDYMITDATVTPPESAEYYSENLVYMPYSYQCNDNSQSIPNIDRKKSEIFGTDDLFIYSSFNNPIKLDPEFFEIWMELLRRTPDSILWILQNNAAAQGNLRRRAEAAGVAAERILFAEMLPRDRHLARMGFADLALDTRIYNGHTTTSDALWAGLPVVAMEGRHFASRVSASLLRAFGLPELIASTPEEYADLALRYAADRNALADLRKRVVANRLTAPLFDTAGFARYLETAYERMWNIRCQGEPPHGFSVPSH